METIANAVNHESYQLSDAHKLKRHTNFITMFSYMKNNNFLPMVKTVIFNIEKRVVDGISQGIALKMVFIPKKGPAYSCGALIDEVDFNNNGKFYKEFFTLLPNVKEIYINFMEDKVKESPEINDALQFLNLLKAFNNLEVLFLNLPHNSFVLSIFKSFATCMLHVRTMILLFANCSLTDSDFSLLNQVTGLVDLETLCIDISNNKLTEHCTQTLYSLIKPPKLKNFYMKIFNNDIESYIIEDLEKKLEVGKFKFGIQKNIV